MQNQDYPFEDLVDKLNVPRDLSRNPIFDTMFVMQNYGLPKVNCEDFRLRNIILIIQPQNLILH